VTLAPIVVHGNRTTPLLAVRVHLRVAERRVAPPGYDQLCPLFSQVDGHLIFVGSVSIQTATAMMIAAEA